MEKGLFVSIERFNNWKNVSTLLCCSWKIRRAFLEPCVLKEVISYIVSDCRRRNCDLPRWCYLSMVVSKNLFSEVGALQSRLLNFGQLVTQRLDERGENLSEEGFITGGFASQVAFGKRWDSDVDVWHQVENAEKHDKRRKMENQDHIYRVEESHACISKFDFSVCQIGVYSSESHMGRTFVTPLFL